MINDPASTINKNEGETSLQEVDATQDALGERDQEASSSSSTKIAMTAIRQRGTMISGRRPIASQSGSPMRRGNFSGYSDTGDDSEHEDLESGSPVGSDMASDSDPPSPVHRLDDIQNQGNQEKTFEDDATGAVKTSSLTNLKVLVLVLSVILLGIAGTAIGLLIFGKKDGTVPDGLPAVLSPRQEMLKEIIEKSAVSDPTLLTNTITPQYAALKWILVDDSLALDPSDGTVSTERVVQRYALATFYFSTDGSQSWHENLWLQGEECTEQLWEGIICGENGTVNTIALDNFGLNGSIPAEIGKLSLLENLIVKNHEGLIGWVPPSLGNITTLRQLGLYMNNLSGSIPSELFMATSLQYLNLQGNTLTGTLSPLVENLHDIRSLVLIGNDLKGEIPFENLAHTSIEFLGLSFNNFTGAIPESVASLHALKYLYLDRNNLIGSIPSALGNVTSLHSINLDYNKITGELPTTVGDLSLLSYFSAQGNAIEGVLPLEMTLMTSLETLNLARNKISGSLFNLAAMKALKSVMLFQNQITGPIPDGLANLDSLEVVFLSANQLTGSIPDVFTAGHSFQGLYLSANRLTGVIPTSICELQKLEALFLDENALTGTIPACISQLGELQQLFLFKNLLTGMLPIEISSMRQLREVGIEDNNMTGTIHDDICTLVNDQGIELWSDCGGNTPEVSCSCCQVCCPGAECS